MAMNFSQYDAWYDSQRGAWIGDAEYQLLSDELHLKQGEQLLDVGCGAGWFTRRPSVGSASNRSRPQAEWLAFAPVVAT